MTHAVQRAEDDWAVWPLPAANTDAGTLVQSSCNYHAGILFYLQSFDKGYYAPSGCWCLARIHREDSHGSHNLTRFVGTAALQQMLHESRGAH